jgi:hypothetical protein
MKQYYDGVPNNLFELILAVKEAAINFNNTPCSVAGFKNVDATVQSKRFSLWAIVVYKGYIEETSFDIEPDNNGLQKHCEERHVKCIMPSLATATSAPTSLSNQMSILKQLGAGLNRMGKANEMANAYAKKKYGVERAQSRK